MWKKGLRKSPPSESEPRYSVETRWSGSETEPSIERMREILNELSTQDPEHPDTWLTHSSGWTLTADEDGALTLSDADFEVVGHLANVARDRVLHLWTQLSQGDVEAIRNQPWVSGRATPDPVKVAAIKAQVEASRQQTDRKFYLLLGEEDRNGPCRVDGCTRGRISVSSLCRVHHFEKIQKRPCPYSD